METGVSLLNCMQPGFRPRSLLDRSSAGTVAFASLQDHMKRWTSSRWLSTVIFGRVVGRETAISALSQPVGQRVCGRQEAKLVLADRDAVAVRQEPLPNTLVVNQRPVRLLSRSWSQNSLPFLVRMAWCRPTGPCD